MIDKFKKAYSLYVQSLCDFFKNTNKWVLHFIYIKGQRVWSLLRHYIVQCE